MTLAQAVHRVRKENEKKCVQKKTVALRAAALAVLPKADGWMLKHPPPEGHRLLLFVLFCFLFFDQFYFVLFCSDSPLLAPSVMHHRI